MLIVIDFQFCFVYLVLINALVSLLKVTKNRSPSWISDQTNLTHLSDQETNNLISSRLSCFLAFIKMYLAILIYFKAFCVVLVQREVALRAIGPKLNSGFNIFWLNNI